MRPRNSHEHHLLTNFQLPSSHLETKGADGWLWVGHLESPLSHLTFCAKWKAKGHLTVRLYCNCKSDAWPMIYMLYVLTHAFRYIKYTFTDICDRLCSISRILTCWANFKLKSPAVKFLGCISISSRYISDVMLGSFWTILEGFPKFFTTLSATNVVFKIQDSECKGALQCAFCMDIKKYMQHSAVA